MISKQLLQWNRKHNHREMPWKGISDPYKIWVSEIILQQTKVEQGEKYYLAFVKKYPSVADLANANQEELYTLWQGLGYYNRCKNMILAAKEIMHAHGGKFPKTHAEILSLKGIGDYTAAAISSFAFHLPYAVVDGNVVRVLSRVFAIKESFHTAKGKMAFQLLAQSLLSKKEPSAYNQAIMDLGALICKPKNPNCLECPFQRICKAYLSDEINIYPTKKIKLVIKERFLHFFLFEDKHHFYITKRTGNDIWRNLFTFFSVESDNAENVDCPTEIKIIHSVEPQMISQLLTHQKITGIFHHCKTNPQIVATLNLMQIKKNALSQFAFPRLLISFLEKNNYL